MEFTAVLFYLFSILCAVSAVFVVASRNPVHSVLCLIFCFFNAAGLFVLLGAEMLAMLLVIVYVGAVAVLFLFVVMMLNIKTARIKSGFQSYLPIGLVMAAVLFIELTLVITNPHAKVDISKKPSDVIQTQPTILVADKSKSTKEQAKEIIEQVENKEKSESKEKTTPDADKESKKKDTKKSTKEAKSEKKTIKTETKVETKTETKEEPATSNSELNTAPVQSVVTEDTQPQKKLTNAQAIGRVIYTDYILYFQLSGLILLVAMIGAIVLTLRHREGLRRQNIFDQVQRDKSQTIRLVNVETGKGIE